jgi:hypothetical protein
MCPKLDHNLNVYVEKIVSLIDDSQVNTITVVMMEVPCCGGMLRFVKEAQSIAKRKVPVKAMIVSVSGEVLTRNGCEKQKPLRCRRANSSLDYARNREFALPIARDEK